MMQNFILTVSCMLAIAGFAVASPVAAPAPQLDNMVASLPVVGEVLAPFTGGTTGTAAAPS